MKLAIVLALLMLISSLSLATGVCPGNKVSVCHVDPKTYRTICVCQ